MSRPLLLRCFGLVILGLLMALPDLAEARGAGRGGRSGGGRAPNAARPNSGFNGGFSSGAPGSFSQARPTQAAPRPGSFSPGSHAFGSGSFPTNLPTSRDLQSILGQGSQASSFSPEQTASKFDSATASANAQAAVTNFQNGADPFSPAWYAEHPTAWQTTHPHADTVAVASAAAVTSWLAYGVYPATTSSVVYEDNSTTVVYEEAVPVPTSQPVYAAPLPTDSAPVEPTPEFDTGEWLNLGVYEIKPTPDAAATQRHQLSVNRDSTLKGVYHDQLTGAVEGLSGRIDSATQQATWWLDINPSVTFTTSLDSLTASSGSVTLTLPTGEQVLTIVREEAL